MSLNTGQLTVIEKAGKLLGKQLNEYKTEYDPSILVPVEREYNRTTYNITDSDFVGYDIWHAYEVSFLTEKGLPTTAVGKIKIPSNSELFIESKSMKLYFYGFNMMRYGKTRAEGMKIIEEIASKDLSEATKSTVEVKLFSDADDIKSFEQSTPIEQHVDVDSIEFTEFTENPDILEVTDAPGECFISIGNVRSNCRVTHQPDFSTLYIKYTGSKTLSLESLQKFVVSFRNENHFHEEVNEQIYIELMRRLQPDELMVSMLSTRRGGIDICPIRTNKEYLLDESLVNVNVLTNKTINQ
jgi:7-cyano-7-deazaguanine reductase